MLSASCAAAAPPPNVQSQRPGTTGLTAAAQGPPAPSPDAGAGWKIGPCASAPIAACSRVRSGSGPASSTARVPSLIRTGLRAFSASLRIAASSIGRASSSTAGIDLAGQLDVGGGGGERPPLAHHDLRHCLVSLARLADEEVRREVGVLHPLDDVQLVAVERHGVDLEGVPVRLPPGLGAKQILQRGRVDVTAQRRDQARVRCRVLRLQLQLAHVGGQRVGRPHAVRLRDPRRLLPDRARPVGLDDVRDPVSGGQHGDREEQREASFHPPILSRTRPKVKWSPREVPEPSQRVRAGELCSTDLVAGGRRNPPRVPVLIDSLLISGRRPATGPRCAASTSPRSAPFARRCRPRAPPPRRHRTTTPAARAP